MIYLGLIQGPVQMRIYCVACQFGQDSFKVMAGFEYAISAQTYARIMRAVQAESLPVAQLYQLSSELTGLYISAIRAALNDWGLKSEQIQAIGLHGQTIQHFPAQEVPYTIQVGDGARVANTLGIAVIDQFRTTDIAVGERERL